MGNPQIFVTADNNPVKVNVSSNTPSIVTVNDGSTGTSKVVATNPDVTVTFGQRPSVTVKYGISRQYDPTGILALLLAGITRDHLDATLISELDGYNTDITTLVNNTALLSADLDVAEASLAVAQADIVANVLSISSTNGQLDIAVSNITQNATDIISAVTRITASEGDISAAQSSIIQNANSITSLVTNLATSDTLISQNASAITAQATALNQTNNTLDQAVIDLTAQGISISVISTDLDNAELSIGSTMEMLNNQYSVTIKQDGLGNDYVSGLKLIMYPDWDEDSVVYAIDDYVWFQNSSWKCILGHTSDATNYPQAGAPGSTYWTEEAEGIKTAFSIQADQFKVQNVAGDALATPFLISGTNVQFNATVEFSGINKTIISGGYINTDLVNANSILSNTITASEIAANTITASEIAANTITASEIAVGTITASEISGKTITASEVAAGSITVNELGGSIAGNTIESTHTDISSTLTALYTKFAEWQVGRGGIFRIKASMNDGGSIGSKNLYLKIYKNGSPHGIEHYVLGDSQTISEDLVFDPRDFVQIYCKGSIISFNLYNMSINTGNSLIAVET